MHNLLVHLYEQILLFMRTQRGEMMKTKALLCVVLALPLAAIFLLITPVFTQSASETGSAAQIPGKAVRIANGNWAPFTGPDLPGQGCDSQVVSEAFALEGIRVEYSFFPWARSYLLSENGVMDGTLEWEGTSAQQATHFVSSDAISKQQWVFFHRKDRVFTWNRLDDLAGKRIGLTIGYAYSDALAAMQQQHPAMFTEATSDLLNLRKLLSGRIDLFPMEKAVGRYLIETELTPEEQTQLTDHPKSLADFSPRLLLSRAIPENNQRILQFNRGMQRLKESGRYAEIMVPCRSATKRARP